MKISPVKVNFYRAYVENLSFEKIIDKYDREHTSQFENWATEPDARGIHWCLEKGKRLNIIVSYGIRQDVSLSVAFGAEFEAWYNRRTGYSAGSFPGAGFTNRSGIQIHEYAIQGCELLWRTTCHGRAPYHQRGAAISYHRYTGPYEWPSFQTEFWCRHGFHFDNRWIW